MKVGSICYATEQGIGMLPKQFYDAGIINSVMIFRHGSRPTMKEWYPPDTIELVGRPFNGPIVEEYLKSIDVLLIFECPFDWTVLTLCKKLGTKTVIVPMYECTPAQIPVQPDKWICPSLLDVEYFPGSEFIPIPVPPIEWQQRTTAKRFLHNGGHLGLRGHKGTLELLQAVEYVKSDLHLTVRSQDTIGLARILQQIPKVILDNPNLSIEPGGIAYEDLFKGYDVLVAPERYNGLSLPLQEARAAGMLVMTSNRFPHNTWLPIEPLIPVASYSRQRVGGGYNSYDEARIDPKSIAFTMDQWYGRDITDYSLSGKTYAEENSFPALKSRWLEALAS